jgi:hypothetical protein
VDRRSTPRFRTRFDSLYSAGHEEGTGVLTDVSYSGACVEKSTVLPPLGSHVRIYVFIQPVSPFELQGRVVRHAGDGFAIEYSLDDPKIRQLVDDVAGIVAAAED